MKTSLKIKMLSVFAIALFFANNAQAQDSKSFNPGFRLGIGLNGGMPTNNDTYDWSLGGDVRLQYDLTQKASLTLTTGFTNLFINQNVKDLGFIPAKIGFKAFVAGDQFYVLGEVGGGFAVTNGYDQNTYIWSPGIGYAHENIDVSLRYEGYTDYDTNQIALRVAYGFKL
jgi:hypothetical protein